MGTFRRFKNAMRANLNDLMDRVGDRAGAPLVQIEQLRDTVREIRTEIAEQRVRIAELERDAERARKDADLAERAAMESLRADDEAAARRHLQRKLNKDREARELDSLGSREREELEQVLSGQRALEERLNRLVASVADREEEESRDRSTRSERQDAETQALRELWEELRSSRGREAPVKDELRDLKDQLDDKPKDRR